MSLTVSTIAIPVVVALTTMLTQMKASAAQAALASIEASATWESAATAVLAAA